MTMTMTCAATLGAQARPAAAAEARPTLPLAKPSIPVAGAYALDDLLTLARRDNFALQSARAQALAGRAGVTTARAYPNPELEVMGASFRARAPGTLGGSGSTLGFSQRIEIVADDVLARLIIETIRACAATGHVGDRLVWVTQVEELWRLGPGSMQTGERA